MKEKKAATIILKIIGVALLAVICLVAAFFLQFNGRNLDSPLCTMDTIYGYFSDGGTAVSRVIDCDFTRKNGIMLSKIYQNEMPGLETQFRFRFMRTGLEQDSRFSDCNFQLTDADGRVLENHFRLFTVKIMGVSCMEIIITLADDEIEKFAPNLFFEVSCTNDKKETYADCKFAIPIEQRSEGDS